MGGQLSDIKSSVCYFKFLFFCYFANFHANVLRDSARTYFFVFAIFAIVVVTANAGSASMQPAELPRRGLADFACAIPFSAYGSPREPRRRYRRAR
jgi:hypothetical protein